MSATDSVMWSRVVFKFFSGTSSELLGCVFPGQSLCVLGDTPPESTEAAQKSGLGSG